MRVTSALAVLITALAVGCSPSEGQPSESPLVQAADSPPPFDPADGAQRIWGQVIDTRSKTGLPDVSIAVRRQGMQRKEVKSTEGGWFEYLPSDLTDMAKVTGLAPTRLAKHWRDHAPQRRALSQAQRDGEEPVVFELAENRRGTFRGVALDSETNEPIPFLSITLRSKSKMLRGQSDRSRSADCTVETDAEGRFLTESAINGGPCRVSVLGGGLRPTHPEFELLIPEDPMEAEPVKLFFEGSPRYRIESMAGEDLTDWTVISVIEGQKRPFATTSVRVDDHGAWCRPPRPRPSHRDDLLLALASPDGHSLGIQRVPWTRTGPARPLRFDVQRLASLTAKLELEPAPPTDDEWADSVGGSSTHFEFTPIGQRPDPLGMAWRTAGLRYLEPGAYRVSAWTRIHERFEADVLLDAGTELVLPIPLPLVQNPRTVRGRVVRTDGEPLPSLDLSLSLDRPERRWDVSYFSTPELCGFGIDHYLEVDETSSNEGSFQIEGVPWGELEVRLGKLTQLQFATKLAVSTKENGDVDVLVTILGPAKVSPSEK